MPEPADPRQPSERYGAIESAYCDDHWGDVISQGQALLDDLSRQDPQAAPEGLRERLQLLMAHAYLYGFGDRPTAEDLYGTVLRSRAEASLRLFAEQGLRQCDTPLPTRSTGNEAAAASAIPLPLAVPATRRPPDRPHLAAEDLPQPIAPSLELESSRDEAEPEALRELPPTAIEVPPAPDLSAGTPRTHAVPILPVMPWLESRAVPDPPLEAASPAQPITAAAPGPEAQPLTAAQETNAPIDSLIPEVIEEPELIEVHQADPRLAEDLELTIKDDLLPASPPQGAAMEEEDPDLLQGLLRVLIR
jgi:hypothetical protein